ncbi:heat stress transcription factor C-1, putative [Entamoeba dispar SAW760]|uniref:Heat stress transcription factor C-1, putative n=1 Tax=Entamoeba dispar (strain ATCC PRA-260 / SAW760) TaxID=370354 RepID=B0EQQ3_ENTDS|nr:heat stress transcription factor C-1, putative [Entamoeba dispar SAW760]EDR23172.1 heat stress transcription factor C-1, putative [Entamoeba dispar SAW760]|eukprot:EDR23172.1 heat stress transcription factor C-1, putative [Entamoeba dispar SAW760]
MNAMNKLKENTTPTPFILKLYELVNNPESQHLMRWCDEPNRNGFVVLEPIELSAKYLPRFFKHNNFSSFVRQLNIYGFHKVDHPQGQCFQHPNFCKDKPELLTRIQRQHSKKADAENTELYKMLLDKLRELQKESLHTQNDLQQLNEMLFTLKSRVDNLDTRMQRVGQFISFFNPNFKPFKREPSFDTKNKDSLMTGMNPWE